MRKNGLHNNYRIILICIQILIICRKARKINKDCGTHKVCTFRYPDSDVALSISHGTNTDRLKVLIRGDVAQW